MNSLLMKTCGIVALIILMGCSSKESKRAEQEAQKEEKARVTEATTARIQALTTAMQAYEMDTGKFPATMSSLFKNDGSQGWRGPYVQGKESELVDSWGTPFAYKEQDNNFKIISAGPDKIMGTHDDMSN